MTRIFTLAAAMILTMTGAAFAHHPLGGMTPQTALHGFLSGVGHPVIGFDHLAFVIGIGLIAAFHRARLVMPAAFVGGTVGGTLLMLAAAFGGYDLIMEAYQTAIKEKYRMHAYGDALLII